MTTDALLPSHHGHTDISGSLRIIGRIHPKAQTELGRQVTCLGPNGESPSPESDMLLRLEMSASKKGELPSRTDEYTAAGAIPHKELDSLKGRLSYPKPPFWAVWEGNDATALSGSICRLLRHGNSGPNADELPMAGGYLPQS